MRIVIWGADQPVEVHRINLADIGAGPAGVSAYESAVAAGFVGSEEQWLASLKGEPGRNVTITQVDTLEAFNAARPGPTELVVLV